MIEKFLGQIRILRKKITSKNLIRLRIAGWCCVIKYRQICQTNNWTDGFSERKKNIGI